MSAYGLNFGNMSSQVQRIIMDVYDDRIDDKLISQWIRQAHIETDGYIKWTRLCEEVTTIAETDEYALNHHRRQIVFVTYGADDEEVDNISIEEMHRTRSAGTSDGGTPLYWAVWANTIHLYPAPGTSDLTLYVWTCAIPDELVCDAEYPSLPPELHQAVVDYALHRAYLHVEDSFQATTYRNAWQGALDRWTSDVAEYRNNRVVITDVEDF